MVHNASSRPIVGLTTYREPLHLALGEIDAAVLPHGYATRVKEAGGEPVLIPPVASARHVAARLDAIVLTGGGDIEPVRYTSITHPAVAEVRPFRDEAELGVVKACLELDMPVLGICRGYQLLNVALGGSLYQHVPDVVPDRVHKVTPGTFAQHEVSVDQTSRLAQLVGERLTVPSHHHQALRAPGSPLRVTAWSDDGLPEAVESASHRFVVGVQWHPEEADDLSLFEELVRQAADYAQGKPEADG